MPYCRAIRCDREHWDKDWSKGSNAPVVAPFEVPTGIFKYEREAGRASGPGVSQSREGPLVLEGDRLDLSARMQVLRSASALFGADGQVACPPGPRPVWTSPGAFDEVLQMLFMALAMAAAPLHWPAPRLDHPQTIALGSGPTVSRLDPDKDYILRLPASVKRGSTVILGGRNVWIVGGQIAVPAEDKMRRAIYIKGATGTVHIEGVLINNPDGGEFDAIAIAAPAAIVQVERVRVEGLQGTQATFHSDVIQPWGGVRELRVDHLTATSAYQGLQLPDMHGASRTGPIALMHVNLRYAPPLRELFPGAGPNKGGFLLWTIHGRNCAMSTRLTLREVYILQNRLRRPENAVWPPATSKLPCAVELDSNKTRVLFPRLPVDGQVILGEPPKGDFVPAGSVGTAYRGSAAVGQLGSAKPEEQADQTMGSLIGAWSQHLLALVAKAMRRLSA